MNLKTWFKGLGVFVLSSLVTAAATMTLDPASFNFSKAGLAKVGVAALIIGLKAVLLYMKQSPLPAGQSNFNDWSKISGAAALFAILPAVGLLSGCVSSWDRTTYASLAASKALIDCAVAGYNHFDADIRHACAADPQEAAFDPARFYLPQTRAAQQAVERARQAQVTAVEAFAAYATAKIGKDKTVTIEEKQAAAAEYLKQLPTLVNAIRGLMGKSQAGAGSATGGRGRPLSANDREDPLRAIEALNPAVELGP